MSEADDKTKTIDNAKALKLRAAINDAYAFVLSQELNSGISAIDFDVLMQQELAELKEGTASGRPSRLQELDALKNRVHDAIAQTKKLDPDAFAVQTEGAEVNTEE